MSKMHLTFPGYWWFVFPWLLVVCVSLVTGGLCFLLVLVDRSDRHLEM